MGAAVAGILASSAYSNSAEAQTTKWWPVEVQDWSSGSSEPLVYEPMDAVSKKWHVCVLIPHLKDTWWLAINYGLVNEARRKGIKLTIFEAGGYANLTRQVSQYDDCISLGADAVIAAVVSVDGMTKKFDEGKAKGIVNIGMANQLPPGSVDGQVFGDTKVAGYIGGLEAVELLKGVKNPKVVVFPGPAGAGFAEAAAQGFQDAIKGTDIEVLDEKYGDLGRSVQLRLVEDALQAYDRVDMIFGAAVTAEVAMGAVAEAGLEDSIKIATWYSNASMIDAVESGAIEVSTLQWPMVAASMALDLAVRNLEGKAPWTEIHTIPTAITTSRFGEFDMSLAFAPADYSPVFNVE